MKQYVCESRNPTEAREMFKDWMAKNPEIAERLGPTDVEVQIVRAVGGTLYRVEVNLPSN